MFHIVELLHEPLQMAFDYSIRTDEPRSVDNMSKDWTISITVNANANKNMDICAEYLINSLDAISMTLDEAKNLVSNNKDIFYILIVYNNEERMYYLRKDVSFETFKRFRQQWEGYARSFKIENGIDTLVGVGKIESFNILGSEYLSYYARIRDIISIIKFPNLGESIANFNFQDNRSITEIEQMTDYNVTATGVRSAYKNGGFVVYEKDGHGLAMSIRDFGIHNWNNAKIVCSELVYKGYDDWHLPSKKDWEMIEKFLLNEGFHGIYRVDEYIWTSNAIDNNNVVYVINPKVWYNNESPDDFWIDYRTELYLHMNCVIPVRSF
jgi:hypothetical protein